MRTKLKGTIAGTMALATIAAFAFAAGTKAATNADGANLVGNWSGESICVGYRPACHDEKVIYHFTKPPDAKGKITLSADKIINGKPEPMWDLDFIYDSEKHTLTSEFTVNTTHGVWEFTVKGDTMEGTLIILPDKTVARKVKVKKEKLTS